MGPGINNGEKIMEMKEASIENNKSLHHRSHLCGGRYSGLLWGSLFLAGGFLWLAKKAGWIFIDTSLFWPAAVMLMGLFMIAGAFIRKRKWFS
jgi:hypothetical protein